MFDLDGSVATKASPLDRYGQDTFNKVVRVGGATSPSRAVQMPHTKEAVPKSAIDSVSARFVRLRDEWLREVSFSNSMDEIVSSEPYREIATIGPAVVPFILEDLEKEPKPWFYVLRQITGADPVRRSAVGDMSAMAAAWLDWGKKNGYR